MVERELIEAHAAARFEVESAAAQAAPRTVIDANELLWAALILAGLVRLHRNVIPTMREKVKVAQAILESYADVPDLDPREQRWTIVR